MKARVCLKYFVNDRWAYRIGKQTILKITQETCAEIWRTFTPMYLKSPSSEREWVGIANDLEFTTCNWYNRLKANCN